MRALLVGLVNALRLAVWTLRGVLRLATRRKVPRFVAFELTGDVPDREQASSWRRWTRRGGGLRVRSVQEFGTRLEVLRADPRIAGIVIKIEGLQASLARVTALRAKLAQFRAAGKRVVAYVRAIDSREYMLAVAADEIYVAPAGRIDLTGFAADATVAGAALKRFGVKAEFVRRGEYKTAPEMFTNDEVSPAQRKTLEGLLDELYAELIAVVAEGRKLDPATTRAIVDAGPYTPQRAIAAKLVDGIADGEDLERITAAPGASPTKLATYAGYAGAIPFSKPNLLRLRRAERLGIVRVRGVIKTGESTAMPLMGSFAGSDSVIRALRVAREDRSLRGVLLAVDSRGGSALASELVQRAVERCAAEKPVVAFVDRVAASGGYMVACPASTIISSPTALIGSIGVFAGKFEASALLEKLGISSVTIQRGEHASMLSPVKPLSADERSSLDQEIEDVYRDFVRIVAKGRKLSEDDVHQRGEGRVFSGRAALEKKLVDQLGGFEDALRRLGELAKVRGEPSLTEYDFTQRAWNPLQALRPLAGEVVWAMLPLGLSAP